MSAAAQPARNASSCSGYPVGVAQPRGLATKTCTVSAPISRAYARPVVASPPATGTCPPTGLRTAAGSRRTGTDTPAGCPGGVVSLLTVP